MSSFPLPHATPEDIGLSTAGLARLGRVMQNEVQRGRVPGAVALVARRGQLAYHESFGQRDPASGAPMARDSIFRIYSMTKPIVSAAAMMLWEEGRFLLSDPVSKFLPELGNVKVAVAQGADLKQVDVERAITIQDLLRHTSGLTYEFRGNGPVHKMYNAARIYSRDQSNADQVTSLSKLPLLHQPGTKWEYSRSTDVIGRLVEVLSGMSLGQYLQQQLFAPLGMLDTAFHVPVPQQARLAEAFAKDPDTGTGVQLVNVKSPPGV